jgi:Putative addiction module component
MIPVTVYVPENKLSFFNELLNHLQLKQEKDDELPAWHKEIIDQRLEQYTHDPSDSMDWDEVKHTFILNNGKV